MLFRSLIFYPVRGEAMSVHIKQIVREQPDTGYRKSQRAAFATARLNGYLGTGGAGGGNFSFYILVF